MTDDKLVQLPVRHKPATEERTLVSVESRPCAHFGPYEIDESAAEVTCKHCKAKLNPMWVLQRLAHKETNQHIASQRYTDEMQRLAERSRTKCEHCHKMTRISRS